MKIPNNVTLYIALILTGFSGFLASVFAPKSIAMSIFIIFTSLGGLMLSSYIFYVKRCDKPLVCPTGSNCKAVIFSKYSKFFGIPLEYLGILYYSFIIGIYSMLLISPGPISNFLLFSAFSVTATAFLFSLYLTSVQAFALRHWCMWCLLSAVFSSTIFIISLSNLNAGADILISIQPWITVAQTVAFSIGVGAATTTALLFFRFLKDLRISDLEKNTLQAIYQLIWFALAILILTEAALYTISPNSLTSSSQFLLKYLSIIIITLGWLAINLILTPWLIMIHFEGKTDTMQGTLIRLRKMVFMFGAIAVGSWYFAFTLNVLPNLDFSLAKGVGIYGIFLLVLTSISLLKERRLSRTILYQESSPS